MSETEGYLTDQEVADRLRVSAKTLRHKVGAGIFRAGEHFFRPPGMRRRWKWAAVVAWLEGTAAQPQHPAIRLARPGLPRRD